VAPVLAVSQLDKAITPNRQLASRTDFIASPEGRQSRDRHLEDSNTRRKADRAGPCERRGGFCDQ